jgi:hypothetical protein
LRLVVQRIELEHRLQVAAGSRFLQVYCLCQPASISKVTFARSVCKKKVCLTKGIDDVLRLGFFSFRASYFLVSKQWLAVLISNRPSESHNGRRRQILQTRGPIMSMDSDVELEMKSMVLRV